MRAHKVAKKDPIKPLFPLKHEFVESLDAYTQAAGNLASAIGIVLRGGDLKPAVAAIIKERLDAFDAARSNDQ